MSDALSKRLYALSEPHLSGYRLVLGFETLAECQAAHEAIAVPSAAREPGWIDQNHQIDRYGVALMMIREGCADPAGLARRILSEFEASPVPSAQENSHD